jgi:serine/threonine-protein kinase
VLRAELAKQPEMIDRMRVEGEALELLSHPNIVGARGHGITRAGRPYVAMERVTGPTLKEELRRRGALPLDEAVGYTRQVLAALKAVHEAGIVHRDVKPENIVVSRHGDAPRLKLLDFGVAKVEPSRHLRIAPLALPTLEGQCVGTPRYASPEQARGDVVVDKRADIYAAGILLYTMVAGRGPFDQVKGAGRVLQAHISEAPPPPSQFAALPVPRAIEAIILRAIAKDARDRYADAVTFDRELVHAMAELSEMASADTEVSGDDACATQIFVRPGSEAVTVVAPRFDLVSTMVVGAVGAGATPAISRVQVLLSAAAFATVAAGLAMWLVR